jgi:hypothetical protein
LDDNIKMVFPEVGWGHGLDLCGSEYGTSGWLLWML